MVMCETYDLMKSPCAYSPHRDPTHAGAVTEPLAAIGTVSRHVAGVELGGLSAARATRGGGRAVFRRTVQARSQTAGGVS